MAEIVKLFGTDGIRGVANQWPLSSDFVVRLGQSIGKVIAREEGRLVVTIGCDTRVSGHMLESALAAGLMSQGVDILQLGVVTTPGIAYLTAALGACLGVVISASHNPYEDNGIKIFGPDGFKIPDEMEEEIERIAQSKPLDEPDVRCSNLGRRMEGHDCYQDYLNYLQGVINAPRPLEGMYIALDCANGAASELAPIVFEQLGARLVLINDKPDGLNINQGYDSLRPKLVRDLVLKEGAGMGVAFDGDGDRAILVDEQGNFIDGDYIMAILAREMKSRGRLKNDTVVATVMSNLGLELSLREAGIALERTPVGDRFISHRMREGDFSLGGEQSGHILIFGDGHTTGDGIYTALKVAEAMVNRSTTLSHLASCMQKYPQVLVNVKVSCKPPFEDMPEIQRQVERAKAALGDEGRIVLRYSGTENLARVMIEGSDQELIEREAQALADVIRQVIK